MVINPCLKFHWTGEYWTASQRQNAKVFVKDEVECSQYIQVLKLTCGRFQMLKI